MAAVSDSPVWRVLELRFLRAGDLNALLDEEIQEWADNLDWDFRGSAGLVRRFLEMQALNGFALLMNGYPVGYCYFVTEERKGLIGDLYVMKDFVTVENEERLLTAVVDHLVKTTFIHRIESQIMMLRNGPALRLPQQRYLRVHPRNFMQLDTAALQRLSESQPKTCGVVRPLVRAQAGRSRIHDRRRLPGAHRQRDQRPVPVARRRAPVPDEHHSVPRLRQLLSAGVVRGAPIRIRASCAASVWPAWCRPTSGTSRRCASTQGRARDRRRV